MTDSQKGLALKGQFITMEGIDGCGKSTQSRLLAGRLRALGVSVLETREPGGTGMGKALRTLLLDPEHEEIVPNAELLLYLADRVQHLREMIVPALSRGELVLCDRFHDATVAYQSYGRGLSLENLQAFLDQEIHAFPPNLTFWLDVPLEKAQKRINERASREHSNPRHVDRMEALDMDFHDRVRKGYASLLVGAPERMVRIPAEGSVEGVAALIWKTMEARYGI